MTLEEGAWVMLQADAGLFHREARLLDLSGNVALFHDSGYEVRTEAAAVDLSAGTAQGEDPVSAQGPAGTLDAVGFTLIERGDIVVFKGPARMVLVPTARPAP
jgi:lipopolysaccharide export system protein LptC